MQKYNPIKTEPGAKQTDSKKKSVKPPITPAIKPILNPKKYPGKTKNKLLHKFTDPPCGILKISICKNKTPSAIKIPACTIILLFKKTHSKPNLFFLKIISCVHFSDYL